MQPEKYFIEHGLNHWRLSGCTFDRNESFGAVFIPHLVSLVYNQKSDRIGKLVPLGHVQKSLLHAEWIMNFLENQEIL